MYTPSLVCFYWANLIAFPRRPFALCGKGALLLLTYTANTGALSQEKKNDARLRKERAVNKVKILKNLTTNTKSILLWAGTQVKSKS